MHADNMMQNCNVIWAWPS